MPTVAVPGQLSYMQRQISKVGVNTVSNDYGSKSGTIMTGKKSLLFRQNENSGRNQTIVVHLGRIWRNREMLKDMPVFDSKHANNNNEQ